ncbi:MAG: hypothetical protein WA996_08625 [Candidatus Promineifilaceae bacterium]
MNSWYFHARSDRTAIVMAPLLSTVKSANPIAVLAVIMMTARDEESSVLRGFSLGADD